MRHETIDLSQRNHRRLIGVLGLLLPILLYGVAGLRPTEGLARWAVLPSVSAYYYTGAVGIFIGLLFALSLFLLTYPGYKGVVVDRVVGRVGGVAALGVAMFPTTPPVGLAGPSWWGPGLKIIHYGSAVLLFVSFILFSIWLFRKTGVTMEQDRPPAKRRRDLACLICGIVMVVCVLWVAIAGVASKPIFIPEAFAIVAFAVSWLVKGEAYEPVLSALRRLSPGQDPSAGGHD